MGKNIHDTWWCHQMETFSVLLVLCAGNSPVTGEFPAQRSVTRSFDVFFDLRLNKRLSKQSWCWRFGTLSRPLWRHCNGLLWQMSSEYPWFIYIISHKTCNVLLCFVLLRLFYQSIMIIPPMVQTPNESLTRGTCTTGRPNKGKLHKSLILT